MKWLILAIVLAIGCASPHAEPVESMLPAQAYFCPQDDCTSAILAELSSAEKSIHCAFYLFTLPEAADAIVQKHRAGVDVSVAFEAQFTDSKWSQYGYLEQSGVQVRKDSNPELMHSKYCVIDGKTVITGSFNWTRTAAELNDENILIIRSPELAEKYESNFRRL
ncbi:MAG: phospholipase D family protein [archaeon]